MLDSRKINPKSIRPNRRKISAPWWNDKCTDTINTLYRIYKIYPTQFEDPRSGNISICKKIEKGEKIKLT